MIDMISIEDLEKGLKEISSDLRVDDNVITSKQLAATLDVYTNEIIRTLKGFVDND